MRPLLLDLFCGAGGAAMGYYRAGFDVVGVDINPQPRYPFGFHRRDALEFLMLYGGRYAAFHASPPCQKYSSATTPARTKGKHPDLVGPTRYLLSTFDQPHVIENVPGAPLVNPTLLCGMMFGLNVYRHRLFESNVPLPLILHPPHHKQHVKMGRPVKEGDIVQVVGNFSGVRYAREAMGIDWMGQKELSQSIPPTYTEWIGRQIIGLCEKRGVA